MARSEDGEFELLVGNKQLLSIVFVLMVLFGIVFSMGYFVGRNSAPEVASAAPVPTAEASRHQRPDPAGAVRRPAPADFEEHDLAPGEAKLVTAPVTASPPAALPADASETPAPPAAPSAAPPVRGLASPAPGQVFLQVAAVKRPEAELMVDLLRKKGFPALVAPVITDGRPSDVLFRALVGPLRDGSDLAKTRAELEALQFKPIVRKY